MSKSREQLIEMLGNISVEGRTVLDVGVQDNSVLQYVKGEPKNYKTTDIDKEWDADYNFDLNNPLDDDIGQFDDVFCLEVLEHVWNPLQAVETLSKLTKERCIISTPFIQVLHDKWDFLRYTYQWFSKVLPMYGFKNGSIRPRKASVGANSLKAFYEVEGIRMSKVTQKMGGKAHYFDIGYFLIAEK